MTRETAPGHVRRHIAGASEASHLALHDHPAILRLRAPDLQSQEYAALIAAYAAFYAEAERRRAAAGAWPAFSLAGAVAALCTDMGQPPGGHAAPGGAARADPAHPADRTDTGTAGFRAGPDPVPASRGAAAPARTGRASAPPLHRPLNGRTAGTGTHGPTPTAALRPPGTPDLAPIDSPQRLLGMLYVLHGASFGGQVIARDLAHSLPHLSHAFFSQPTDPQLWRQLVTALDRAGASPDTRAEIEAGTLHTFTTFGRWVTGCTSR